MENFLHSTSGEFIQQHGLTQEAVIDFEGDAQISSYRENEHLQSILRHLNLDEKRFFIYALTVTFGGAYSHSEVSLTLFLFDCKKFGIDPTEVAIISYLNTNRSVDLYRSYFDMSLKDFANNFKMFSACVVNRWAANKDLNFNIIDMES